jgi:iron-sulfur cluster repair protein YtfE (RIC family)
MTGPARLPTIVPRAPHEPAPDLTDYVVVHRAMTVDVRRLARAAQELAGRADGPRARALRAYLAPVLGEIRSHHQVEDDVVWPLLGRAAGGAGAAVLAGLTDDHHELDQLLDGADMLAEGLAARPADGMLAGRLATCLTDMSALLDRHVADEERDVFPLIRRHVRVEDYRWAQQRFRGNLDPRLLPFVVPWVLGHATPDERPAGPAQRCRLAAAGALRSVPRPVRGAVEAGVRVDPATAAPRCRCPWRARPATRAPPLPRPARRRRRTCRA